VRCSPLAHLAFFGIALALTSSVWPGAALAFCRTSTCTDCPRDPATGCVRGGTPIAWPDACLSFSMNRAASATIDLDAATALMIEAFATWEGARCGSDDEPPSVRISHAFGPARCAQPEYNPSGGNANLIVFRDDAWPYTSKSNQLAATSLTFDDDGAIYDADVEFNATGPLALPMSEEVQAFGIFPGERAFGIIPDEQHDLLSIMVHEAGHFLGLDHSREESSVMQAELGASEVRRQLSADDVAAICAVYPPDRAAPACDPTPHGGFASACDSTTLQGGCSLQPQARAQSVEPTLFASLVSLLYFRRLRRRSER
jgi:Matrixin